MGRWSLTASLPPVAQATEDAEYLYNPFMASLSTAPVPFNGMYGHWHALTAGEADRRPFDHLPRCAALMQRP